MADSMSSQLFIKWCSGADSAAPYARVHRLSDMTSPVNYGDFEMPLSLAKPDHSDRPEKVKLTFLGLWPLTTE